MSDVMAVKLRDKNTGLFSSGGTGPYWSKKGKVWRQMSHLKLHLNLVGYPLKAYNEAVARAAQRRAEAYAPTQLWMKKIDDQYLTTIKPPKHPYEGCDLEAVVLYYMHKEDSTDTIPITL